MDKSSETRTPKRILVDAIHRFRSGLLVLPWLETATFLVLGGIYLSNAFRFKYPAGYAGLYTLMAEILAQKPFPLPMEIPYYGPGGIPFAYPPVAAYIAALFIGPLRVPAFTYLQWEPGIVCILAMLGVYLLGRELSGDRLKGLVGTVIVFSAEIVYSYHGTASGSVRGLALLWTVLAACFALRAYRRAHRWCGFAVLAGLFLALTITTHLAYAAFLAPGIVLMAFLQASGRPFLDRAKTLMVIAATAALLSAPWWGTIVARYGPAVFLNASGTHGTLGLLEQTGLNPMAVLRAVLRWYVNLGGTWWPAVLAGLMITGFAYSVARGRWLLPIWMVVAVVTLGQTDRFEILLVGLLGGEALVDLSRNLGAGNRTRTPIVPETLRPYLFLVLVLVPVVFLGFRGIQWTDVALSDDLVQAATWVRKDAPEGSEYLYLGKDHDVAEWLPYLTRLTPGVSPWGAEWTGSYDEQLQRLDEVNGCVGAPDVTCLNRLISSVGGKIEWLIVPVEGAQPWPALVSDPDWEVVYANGGIEVYHTTR
jgi:hypothetical protein